MTTITIRIIADLLSDLVGLCSAVKFITAALASISWLIKLQVATSLIAMVELMASLILVIRY